MPKCNNNSITCSQRHLCLTSHTVFLKTNINNSNKSSATLLVPTPTALCSSLLFTMAILRTTPINHHHLRQRTTPFTKGHLQRKSPPARRTTIAAGMRIHQPLLNINRNITCSTHSSSSHRHLLYHPRRRYQWELLDFHVTSVLLGHLFPLLLSSNSTCIQSINHIIITIRPIFLLKVFTHHRNSNSSRSSTSTLLPLPSFHQCTSNNINNFIL